MIYITIQSSGVVELASFGASEFDHLREKVVVRLIGWDREILRCESGHADWNSDGSVTRSDLQPQPDWKKQRKRPWEIYETWWPKFRHPNCYETSWKPSSCFLFISIQPSFVWPNNLLWLNSAMHDYFENLLRFSAAMSRDGLFGHVYCYYLLFLKHL